MTLMLARWHVYLIDLVSSAIDVMPGYDANERLSLTS
jgi:hypothetical protein